MWKVKTHDVRSTWKGGYEALGSFGDFLPATERSFEAARSLGKSYKIQGVNSLYHDSSDPILILITFTLIINHFSSSRLSLLSRCPQWLVTLR